MDITTIFGKITEYEEKYVNFLKDICSFEATAYDKETIDEMIKYIKAFAEKEGMTATVTSFENLGDFLSIDINEGNDKGAVFLAHTDTVHKKGIFGYPAVKVDGNCLIAPGAVDCKGGIAVALLAMKALLDSGYKKHARLILTSDEEVSTILGGEKEIEFFKENTQGFPYALNCEVTENDEVVVSRKGILKYKIKVIGKGGHSGIQYFDCVNPVLEASRKIVALEEKSQRGSITYSCNVISAGTTSNVIPDTCSFTIDVRVVKNEDMKIAKETVKTIAEKSFIGNTTSEITLSSARPPMEKNGKSMALFDKLNNISIKNGLGELTHVESGGGSDSAYTQMAGVTSLCGLGPSGKYYHTNRELVFLDTVTKRAKLLSCLLVEDN